MSYHNIDFRLKKLKRGVLIWITLISLLINLWLDNIRFTIFKTKSSKKIGSKLSGLSGLPIN